MGSRGRDRVGQMTGKAGSHVLTPTRTAFTSDRSSSLRHNTWFLQIRDEVLDGFSITTQKQN